MSALIKLRQNNFLKDLTIEVKILDKKMKENVDLVELNLRDNAKGPKAYQLHLKKVIIKD